MYSFTENRQTI